MTVAPAERKFVQSIVETQATDEIYVEERSTLLPELSRPMAYTTRKTVNGLKRKQPDLNHVPEGAERRNKPKRRAQETRA